jgi:DNA-directed RNA polymerase specialized sigma24 family protein
MMNDKTDPRREWENMDGPAQLDAIIGSIYTAGKTWRRNGWSFAGLAQDRDSAETIAGEAWPLVADLLDRCDSLGVALYRAVTTAAQRLYRQEMAWTGRTMSAQMEDDDGTVIDLWEAVAARSASQAIQAGPEMSVTIRHDLEALAETQEDKTIIHLLGAGYTVRQIADIIGASKSTVQRRIDRIRARAGDPTEWFAALG